MRRLSIAALLLTACSEGAGGLDGAAGADAGSIDAPLTRDSAVADAERADAPAADVEPADAEPADAGAGDAAAGDAGAPAWAPRAALGRGARQETAVVALGGEVYVIGGFAGAQVVPWVEIYDPTADAWRDGPDLPVAMHHANAAVLEGRIYVLGFLTGLNFAADGRGYVYDPAAGRWDPVAVMPAGSARGASGLAVLDGFIYVAGGFRGGAVSDFSRFSPASGWEVLGPLPAALDHLVAGALGGEVLVVGGRGGSITSHTSEVRAYDPAGGSWRTRASMPTSRGGAASAIAGGRFYVMGGEGNPVAGAAGVFPQVEAYDPIEDRWTALPPMRTPRHGTGAAAVGDRIYVPGGATQQGFGAVADHEVLLLNP